MQHAYQSEQPPRGLEIDFHAALQPLHHQRGTFVVQTTTAHVDRLDARLATLLHGVGIAVDQHLVVFYQPAERTERQAENSDCCDPVRLRRVSR